MKEEGNKKKDIEPGTWRSDFSVSIGCVREDAKATEQAAATAWVAKMCCLENSSIPWLLLDGNL